MYIKNKDLISLIEEYKKTNIIPEKLHILLYNLSKNIASRPNWRDYTWKEDMISDAYLKCLLKLDKFDTKQGNAFSYFTTIIFHFFVDVVKHHKKHASVIERLTNEYITQLEMQFNVFFNKEK